MSTLLEKIKSVKLCLMAHPDNEQNSEFADRISDLEEIEKGIENKELFAIGFAEWSDNLKIGEWSDKTTKELLEIYKKQYD